MPIHCKSKTRSGRRCRNSAVTADGLCNLHAVDPSRNSGVAFEEAVASVLRVLGYTVKRDVFVPAGQVDLFAEMQVGVLRHRLLVECKDYGNRSVSQEDVRDFAARVDDARREGTADQGLFVTTHRFGRHAERYAPLHGITLTTYHELSSRLVDFDDYLTHLATEWEQSDSAKYYVDPSGSDIEDYRNAPAEQLHRPLDRLILRHLFAHHKNHVALLGNFGTGKSTFGRRLAALMAKSYSKTTPDARIPVLLNLSDYDPRSNIQEFITNTLQFRYGVRLDLKVCNELQRLGKFLFILDGFDEMSKQVNPFLIRENLQSLNWLTKFPNNKVILTCRTHFFRDHVQAEMLTDEFVTVYLPEWSEPELKEYLQKRFGQGDSQRYLQFIHATHNLTELAQTPLLLDMIAGGLPHLESVRRRSDLYRLYTDQWLSDQDKRVGAWLDKGQRAQFVHTLAMKLFAEGRHTCHYTDLRPVLRKIISHDDVFLDAMEMDVRTCTFLTRDPHGNYEFKHKSFMEFFVATALSIDIERGNYHVLSLRTLPLEIRQFLIEILEDMSAIEQLSHSLKHTEHPIQRDNIVTLLANLGTDLAQLTLGHDPEHERETRLVALTMQGDERALEELAGECWDVAVSSIVGVLGEVDEPLVEHLVARAFATLFAERSRILRVADFRDNLNKIAHRVASEHRRTMGRRTSTRVLRWNDSVDETLRRDAGQSNDEPISPAMMKLHRAISELPVEEQQVINAHFLQRMPREDTATMLNLPLKRVNTIVHRALQQLGTYLTAAGIRLGRPSS